MRTLGDGNCAFNTFAVGLKNLLLRQRLKKEDIPEAFLALALEMSTEWSSKEDVLDYLSQEYELTNLEEFQTKIAPILRRFAIDYLRDHYQEGVLDTDFYEALNYYAFKDHGKESYDTFKEIPFIKEQLINANWEDKDKQIAILQAWWDAGGRNQYFDHMSEIAQSPADVSRWGSQVELSILAVLFNLAVEFRRNNGVTMRLGCPNGCVKIEEKKPDGWDIDALTGTKKLLERNNGVYSFIDKPTTKSELPQEVYTYLSKYYLDEAPIISAELSGYHWSYIAPGERFLIQQPKYSDKTEIVPPDPQEYKASGLKATLHGVVYQLALLMHVMRQSMAVGREFELATEMDDAEKFDDVVIKIQDQDGRYHLHCFQAKHKQQDNVKISATDLLNVENADFSLLKYFDSYRKIKEKFKDVVIGDLVIFTNAVITESTFGINDIRTALVENTTTNGFIAFDGSKQYRIAKYKDISLDKLYAILVGAPSLHRLARTMAEIVVHEKSFDKRDPTIKEFNVALAKEVLESGKKCLREDFLNKSTGKPQLDLLLDLFIQYAEPLYKKKCQTALAKEIQKDNTKNTSFQEEFQRWLKTLTTQNSIKCSVKFGQQSTLETNPYLAKPINTARDLFDYLKNDVITVEKKQKSGLVQKELAKLAGHVIVLNEDGEDEGYSGKSDDRDYHSYKFSKAFCNSKDLPGNLNDFRESFISFMQMNHSKLDLKKCIIRIKKFPGGSDTQYIQSIPNENITKAEVDDFFDHLILATSQPNVTELLKLLREDFIEEFNLLNSDLLLSKFQSRMLLWLQNKKGISLNKHTGNEIFDAIQSQLSSLIMLGPVLEYGKQLVRIQFEEQMELEGLLQSTHKVQCIRVKSSYVATKVFAALKARDEYKQDDAFIILKAQTVQLMQHELSTALTRHHLMIIDCNIPGAMKLVTKILELVKSWIESNKKLKVWLLIAADMTTLAIENLGIPKAAVTDTESANFADLKKTTRAELLEQQLHYQSGTIQLQELCDTTDWITEDFLPLLSGEQQLELNFPAVMLNEFDGSCYIQRNFQRTTTLHPKILTECPDGVFLLCLSKELIALKEKKYMELSEYEKTLKSFNLSNQKDKDEFVKFANTPLKIVCVNHDKWKQDYRKLMDCRKEAKAAKEIFLMQNIHVLEQKKDKLCWLQSIGTVTALHHYLDKTVVDELNEDDFREGGSAIIAAEPGMGKSMVITHMIEQGTSKKGKAIPRFWVRVDLKQWKTWLEDHEIDKLEDVIQFLVMTMQLNKVTEVYLNHLLCCKRDKHRVMIFLDGFDEIDSLQQNRVINILKFLVQTSATVCIATRQHETATLENAISMLSYRLRDINKEEQIDYLTKFWQRRLQTKDTKIADLATHVIGKIGNDLKKDTNKFMGIPLQLRLVAEGYEEEARKFIISSLESPAEIEVKIDRVSLYHKIITRKLDIYLSEKLTIQKLVPEYLLAQISSDLLTAHMRVALNILFPNSGIVELLPEQQTLTEEDIKAVGLLQSTMLNESEFVHRTFGEYLVAYAVFSLFIVSLNKNSIVDTAVSHFIYTAFFLDKSMVVRRFFNDMVHKWGNQHQQKLWRQLLSCRLDSANFMTQVVQDILPVEKDSNKSRIKLEYVLGDVKSDGSKHATVSGETNSEGDEHTLVSTGNDKLESVIEWCFKILNAHLTNGQSRYRTVCDDLVAVKRFINGYMKMLSVSRLSDILEIIGKILGRYENSAIVKSAVFDLLSEIIPVYVAKAFFPQKNANYKFEDISKFAEVDSRVYSNSRHIDETTTEAYRKKCLAAIDEASAVDKFMANHEKLSISRQMSKAAITAIHMRFIEEKLTLDLEQCHTLIQIYDEQKENVHFRNLLLMAPLQKEPMLLLMKFFVEKQDLDLLEKLISNSHHADISYHVEGIFSEPIHDSLVYFWLHADNIFNDSELNDIMKNSEAKIEALNNIFFFFILF